MVFGLIESRFIFDLFSEGGAPRSLPQFLVRSVLFVALFLLAGRIYGCMFVNIDPKAQMEFIEKNANEK
jgi:hypothetical protein